MTISKKQFVETMLSSTISIASGRGDKGWVDRLTFDESSEVLTIHCKNGHCYFVNAACDSHLAIVEDVMKEVMKH